MVVKPVNGVLGNIESILLAKRAEPVTNLFYQVGRYVETVVIDDRLYLGFDVIDVEAIYFIRIVASADKIHVIRFVRALSRRLGETPANRVEHERFATDRYPFHLVVIRVETAYTAVVMAYESRFLETHELF